MPLTANSCDSSARSFAAVCPPPLSTLSSRFSPGSSELYTNYPSAYFADHASVAHLLKTIFRSPSLSIMIILVDILITIKGSVFGGIGLLYDSVVRGSAADVVIGS